MTTLLHREGCRGKDIAQATPEKRNIICALLAEFGCVPACPCCLALIAPETLCEGLPPSPNRIQQVLELEEREKVLDKLKERRQTLKPLSRGQTEAELRQGLEAFDETAAVAELERNLIIERVRAGMRRARLEGQHIGRNPLVLDNAAILSDQPV